MNRKHLLLGAVGLGLGLGLGGIGCQTQLDSDEHESTTTTSALTAPQLNQLASVAELVTARGVDSPLGDAPAEASFKKLQTLEAKGLRGTNLLHIYALSNVEEPTAHLVKRAANLGLSLRDKSGRAVALAFMQPERLHGKSTIQGDLDGRRWHLAYDILSGAERMEDDDNFHRGFGPIDKSEQPGLLAAAKKFALKADAAAMSGAHLYKVRQYKNAVAQGDGQPKEETYQVAVAYNTSIDGIPVIGSGGKVVAHVGKGARAVAYETSVRGVGGRRASVPADSLISSAEAEARAWANLAAQGLGKSTHTLSSSQFGYYREGRNSVQATLAPTYAFFFAPIGDGQKKKIEIIDAVTDTGVLNTLEQERKQEAARKRDLVEMPDQR
jgi:hypothetical protein